MGLLIEEDEELIPRKLFMLLRSTEPWVVVLSKLSGYVTQCLNSRLNILGGLGSMLHCWTLHSSFVRHRMSEMSSSANKKLGSEEGLH